MWNTITESLNHGKTQRIHLHQNNTPLRFSDVLQLWRENEEFRTFFIALLADAPFRAFKWETPKVTTQTVSRPFECVLLDMPALDRKPDPISFSDQFSANKTAESIISFSNLGGDARMIAPRPEGPPEHYVHLAALMRSNLTPQKHALWHTVGTQMESHLTATPRWLSTAGMGVAWLHVRIDSRPKYYGYTPYTQS